MMTSDAIKELFLLDRDVIFLNHGSFGACPRVVFEDYQSWQRRLERQPVKFLGRESDELLNEARQPLAAYLNVPAEHVVYVWNATVGLNAVGRSLKLSVGDEILTTDHEYGALNLMWDYICRETGARLVRQTLALESPQALIESLWQGVTERTKLIFFSHITSPTALILPAAEICARGRSEGILTMVDGAHAPGQIGVDLGVIGADFYAGNCHKWLFAPKGSAFLYVRPEHHGWVEPLVVGWGWSDTADFITKHQWQGTRDIAAFLSVPRALSFIEEYHWDEVRGRCHELAKETRRRISEWSGIAPLGGAVDDWFGQMMTAPLPQCDGLEIQRRLHDEFGIEVPLTRHHGRDYVRVSIQGYNSVEDAERLIAALMELIGEGI